MATNTKQKPQCKYGAKCYRKNPQHLKAFRHQNEEQSSDEEELSPPRKRPRSPSPNDDVKKKTKTLDDYFGQSKQSNRDKKDEEIHAEDDQASDSESDKGSEDGDSDVEVPPSPTDVKNNIKQKYYMEMPDDFYAFWDFCQKEKPKNPRDALKNLLGLTLVGPFDILSGRHKGITKNKRGKLPNFKLHYRFYYDPPEFTTVIIGDKSKQFHMGYFRDDPSEMPMFVAVNCAAESGTISPKGDNLFAAIKLYIDEQLKSKGLNPGTKQNLLALQGRITNHAGTTYCLDAKSKDMKERDKRVVCKTFHGAGIVVPVDDNEVGYRPVPESVGDLKRMFKKVVDSSSKAEQEKNMDPIQELITLVQFANDECDYGEGLELGLDLFSYGGEVFHSMIQHLLPLAYQLLRRNEFAEIIKAHLKHRTKGVNNELEV